jgi:hypothetical protein
MQTQVGWDLGPDIEVAADDWADRQKARQEIAEEDANEERWAQVNSCDALRIIDGLPPAVQDTEEI